VTSTSALLVSVPGVCGVGAGAGSAAATLVLAAGAGVSAGADAVDGVEGAGVLLALFAADPPDG
jgi:hypothetical protein